jgi:hypothetical protein
MKSKKSCKYFYGCGSGDNCTRCEGYEEKGTLPKAASAMEIQEVEQIYRFFRQPMDLTTKSIEDRANVLVLHFKGFLAKPMGIEDSVYKECAKAFDNNRGKTEKEEAAVMKVLMGDK